MHVWYFAVRKPARGNSYELQGRKRTIQTARAQGCDFNCRGPSMLLEAPGIRTSLPIANAHTSALLPLSTLCCLTASTPHPGPPPTLAAAFTASVLWCCSASYSRTGLDCRTCYGT